MSKELMKKTKSELIEKIEFLNNELKLLQGKNGQLRLVNGELDQRNKYLEKVVQPLTDFKNNMTEALSGLDDFLITTFHLLNEEEDIDDIKSESARKHHSYELRVMKYISDVIDEILTQ